ncbi:hypothetical protein BN874_1280004 [Candidatus Contendobacter odensis Run_B_J11]|uniref:Uncharacterized protein n=1 Tax=Candidatus Contendobacter odensis Run_B_J11 TaxID=1400861 RepID=A0A7U7G8R8_9GAMM|nr:hypothetical protein BN874_1280004 [Candidatus Contendobacter odensis Run_B_J11]
MRHPRQRRYLLGAVQFDPVALTVVEAQCFNLIVTKTVQRPIQAGGGILSTGQDDEGGTH